jgi:hypothetical protein
MARKIKEIKTGKPKQVKVGFYLDADVDAKLEEISRRHGASKAWLFRKAVTLLLKEYK